jgi:hypothetical protein
MYVFKIHILSLVAGVFLGVLLVVSAGRIQGGESGVRADFISNRENDICRLEGFGAAEDLECGKVRWSYGPEATVEFFLAAKNQVREMLLVYKLVSPLDGQDLEIIFNGKTILRQEDLPGASAWDKWYGKALSLQPKLGTNTVVFRVSKWNGHDGSIASEDSRPLSLLFQKLSLFPK